MEDWRIFQKYGIMMLLFLLSGWPPLLSQFSDFGVKKYGQTIEENFHTVRSIYQDTFNRLLASNLVFDGQSFQFRDSFPPLRTYTINADQFYAQLDPLSFIYVENGQAIDTIHTDIQSGYPISRFVYSANELMVIKTDGLYYYDFNEGKHHFKEKIEILSKDIRDFHQIADTLFFKHMDQSFYITKDHPKDEISYGRKPLSHHEIFYLPNERIMLRNGKDTILNQHSPWHEVMMRYPDSDITANLIDSKNRLWLAIRSKETYGIFYCLPGSSKLHRINYDFDALTLFATLYEDHQGSIWAGTIGSGLYQIYLQPIKVLGKNTGFKTDNVWSVQQNKQKELFFATSSDHIEILNPEEDHRSIQSSTSYTPILMDRQENIWLKGNGVKLFENEKLIRKYEKQDGLYSRSPASFLEDSQGNIWIGSRKVLHQLEAGRFIQYPVPDVGEFDLIFNMVEVEPGEILLATNSQKLFLFKNRQFKEINNPYSQVNRILKDGSGNIWIGTEKDGLLQYQNGQLEKIPEMPQTIYQLQDDLNGWLWGVTTENRVFSVPIAVLKNKKTLEKLNFYDNRHGLPLIDLNTRIQPTSIVQQNGNLIFPNIYGAICINPDLLTNKRKPFKTLINIGEEELTGNEIILAKGLQNLTLELQPVSLLPDHPVEYEYRVDRNKVWEKIETDHKLNLFNLPPRENRISIRGRYVNGAWQDTVNLELYIPPLYYQTYWFRFLLFVLFGLVVYAMVRWRTWSIKQQNIQLLKIVTSQTAALEHEKQQLSEALEQQKKLTKKLHLSQEAKNRMYAQISHEFRTPLQVVKTHFNQSKNGLDPENKAQILHNLNELLNTSNEILELSKAESGKLKAHKNWYNINSIIEDQIQLKKALLTQKDIHLSFQPSKEIAQVFMDLSLMQKVIGNLLSNAIKFSPPSSRILVNSHNRNNVYSFSIEDEGIGIAPAEVDKIVDEYFQGSNNRVGGTGIGLSLVNEILKLHDSKIDIKSELNQGSRFSFEIPHPSDVNPPEQIGKDHKDDLENQLKSMIIPDKPRILCVDDNLEVLKFLRQNLTPDYYVIALSRGELALKNLQKITPKLIISDVNMPYMDGLELLKGVRKRSRFKAVPFVFLTGSASEDTEVIGLSSGADSVLHKPIKVASLKSKVRRVLDQKAEIVKESEQFFSNKVLAEQLQDDDQALMLKLEEVIMDNLKKTDLKSRDIAILLGMGEKTLRNKVKTLTGMTVKEYLRMMRMETAKKLIDQKYGTYSEIATSVGFSSLSYFRKSYKAYVNSQ